MRLLADYPADRASEAVETARAQNWIEALEGLPAWAVDVARRRWLRGEVAGVNPDFPPKPPRFRQLTIEAMSSVHERRNRLTLLLKAIPDDVIPEDERKRVAARLEEFRRELGMTLAASATHRPLPVDDHADKAA